MRKLLMLVWLLFLGAGGDKKHKPPKDGSLPDRPRDVPKMAEDDDPPWSRDRKTQKGHDKSS